MNPTEVVKGGQLGIVAKNRTNLVMMTLMGEYSHRAWEYDDVFQRELERFVEDALQFHLCLNGDTNSTSKDGGKDGDQQKSSSIFFGSSSSAPGGGGGTAKGSATSGGGGGSNNGLPSNSNSHLDSANKPVIEEYTPASSTSNRRGRSKLLGKVLQKVIRD